MDCKHAYFLDGVPYVLCDFEGHPRTKKNNEVAPRMCPYQRFCPNIRACALLPEWVNCHKLKVKVEAPVEHVTPAVTKKSSRAKKSKA